MARICRCSMLVQGILNLLVVTTMLRHKLPSTEPTTCTQYRNQLSYYVITIGLKTGCICSKVRSVRSTTWKNERAYSLAYGDVQQGLNETFRAAQVGQTRAQELAGTEGAAAASGKVWS